MEVRQALVTVRHGLAVEHELIMIEFTDSGGDGRQLRRPGAAVPGLD